MEQVNLRKTNFELIRIFAMLMIIGSHLAGHGVMHCLDEEGAYAIWSNGSITNQIFSRALCMGGEFGVALFFMLTGYFMINSDKIRVTKIFCETLFYGVFVSLLFVVSYLFGYKFQELTIKSLLIAPIRAILIPITGGSWWFITTYAFLILFHTIINQLVAKLNKRGFILLLIVAWVFWYSFGNALNVTFFNLQKGIFFYLIGGFIKQLDVIAKVRNKKAWLALAVILSWLIYTLTNYIVSLQRTDETVAKELIAKLTSCFSTSVLIPIGATAFFLLLGGLAVRQNKCLNKIAATTLGVYLIHDSIYGRSLIWRGILKVDSYWYNLDCFPIAAICFIIIVFAVCSFVDLLRLEFVEPFMIKTVEKIKGKILPVALK